MSLFKNNVCSRYCLVSVSAYNYQGLDLKLLCVVIKGQCDLRVNSTECFRMKSHLNIYVNP